MTFDQPAILSLSSQEHGIHTRLEKIELLQKWYGDGYTAEDFLNIAKNLFGELRTFGIAVPATFSLTTNMNGQRELVAHVIKIPGHNLEDSKKTPSLIPHIEYLYQQIGNYLGKKAEQGGLFLTDINAASQYVFSNSLDNECIYLIDTDLHMGNNTQGLLLTLEWYVRHLRAMEQECKKEFANCRTIARQTLEILIEALKKNHVWCDQTKIQQMAIEGLLAGNKHIAPSTETALPYFIPFQKMTTTI